MQFLIYLAVAQFALSQQLGRTRGISYLLIRMAKLLTLLIKKYKDINIHTYKFPTDIVQAAGTVNSMLANLLVIDFFEASWWLILISTDKSARDSLSFEARTQHICQQTCTLSIYGTFC